MNCHGKRISSLVFNGKTFNTGIEKCTENGEGVLQVIFLFAHDEHIVKIQIEHRTLEPRGKKTDDIKLVTRGG